MRPSNEWMAAHVEAYVDAELDDDEQAHFERAMAGDPIWQREVEHARALKGALRRLPEPSCPPAVTQSVLMEARRRSRARRWEWAARLRRSVVAAADDLWQPALAMAALLAIVLTAARLGGSSVDDGAPPYSAAEVEQAAADVRLALAYVADAGETTGATMQNEVLRPHVASPMQRALDNLLNDTGQRPQSRL